VTVVVRELSSIAIVVFEDCLNANGDLNGLLLRFGYWKLNWEATLLNIDSGVGAVKLPDICGAQPL
jgi:hypothetical protein